MTDINGRSSKGRFELDPEGKLTSALKSLRAPVFLFTCTCLPQLWPHLQLDMPRGVGPTQEQGTS